jgi:hypothetical protein
LDSDGKSWLWDGYDDDGGSVSGVDLSYAVGRGWASSTGKPLFTDMGYGVAGDEDTGAGGELMTVVVDGEVTGTVSSTDTLGYSMAEHALSNPAWGIENGILKPVGGQTSGPTLVPPAAGGVQVGPIMIQTANGNFVPLGSQAGNDFAVAPNDTGSTLPSVDMRLPDNPSGLGPEWVNDPTHKNPNGERYKHPNGDTLDWHPAQPGADGWRGQDHWHSPNAPKGVKQHLPPGTEIPDPRPPSSSLSTGDKVIIGASSAVVGYGLYRGARMLPSLLPPLWWTIPINFATP